MENELLIEKGKPSLTCGIYLTGMNLKEYMQKLQRGELPSPCNNFSGHYGDIEPYLEREKIIVLQDSPLVAINMPCGEKVVYRTLEDMPTESVACTCGDPTHWFIKCEED